MGAKAELGWTRRTEDDVKLDVYAQHVGTEWIFYTRTKRYERWELVKEPPLEDWLKLLDAVERMIPRRRFMPDEAARIRRAIRERFPEAEV